MAVIRLCTSNDDFGFENVPKIVEIYFSNKMARNRMVDKSNHPIYGRITTMSKNKIPKPNKRAPVHSLSGLIPRGMEIDELLELLKLDMHSLAVSAGTALITSIIQSEADQLTGGLYSHEGDMYPWGFQRGYIMIGGQKVPVDRPRVRKGKGKGKGKEVPLASYKKFQQKDERTNRVHAASTASVSCRDYAGTIEKAETGYGVSKSVVSREHVVATSQELDEMFQRPLNGIDVVVLLIDGIEIGGSVFICAMGVDRTGNKHVLGFLDGATENSDVCKRLLENLRDRGLGLERVLLCVLDGSKALSKAVRHICGEGVQIQRCREHKIRNVRSHLTKQYQFGIERKIRAAYKMNRYEDARQALQSIVRELYTINDTAAHSLEEGLEETLTVHRLGMPAIIRKSLATTNMIESMYSRSRQLMRNVKRWTTDNQKARWLASALLKTEKSFLRIAGCQSMPAFVVALEAKENQDIPSPLTA